MAAGDSFAAAAKAQRDARAALDKVQSGKRSAALLRPAAYQFDEAAKRKVREAHPGAGKRR